MKIPKQFNYKGRRWRVLRELDLHHDDGTKCHGICDTDAQIIYLEASLSKPVLTATFLHELFHVMMHQSRVPENAELTEDIEDILADNFSDLLIECFNVRWNNGKNS
jgi:hypothetical protein